MTFFLREKYWNKSRKTLQVLRQNAHDTYWKLLRKRQISHKRNFGLRYSQARWNTSFDLCIKQLSVQYVSVKHIHRK